MRNYVIILLLTCILGCSNNSKYEELIQKSISNKSVPFELNGKIQVDELTIISVSILKSGIANDGGTGFASIKAIYQGNELDLGTYFTVGKDGYDENGKNYVIIQEPLISKTRLLASREYQNY